MHYGRLDGPNDTAAKRVYWALRAQLELSEQTPSLISPMLSTRDLNEMARTPCASTRVSEVRRQLPPGLKLPPPKRAGNVWYYRLVRTEETGDE